MRIKSNYVFILNLNSQLLDLYMQLLDGKYVSEKLKGEIAEEAAKILARNRPQTTFGGCFGWARWRQRNLCGQQDEKLRSRWVLNRSLVRYEE